MCKFLRLSCGIVFVMTVLLAPKAKAQFERVNAIVSAVEEKFEERYGAFPSAERTGPVTDNSVMKKILLSPLQWEVKKIQMQSSLLIEKNDSIAVKIAASERELSEISAKLFEQGIHNEQDLGRLLAEQRESKKQVRIAKLEVEALELAGQNDREVEKRKIDLARAELKVEAQESVVEQSVASNEYNQRLVDKGVVSYREVKVSEAQIEQAKAELELLKLEMQKAKIETQPGYSNELRLAMARLEKLASNEEPETLSAESFAQLQSLVKRKQGLTMIVERARSEQAMVQSQLATMNLEQRYLQSVIESYSEMFPPQEKE